MNFAERMALVVFDMGLVPFVATNVWAWSLVLARMAPGYPRLRIIWRRVLLLVAVMAVVALLDLGPGKVVVCVATAWWAVTSEDDDGRRRRRQKQEARQSAPDRRAWSLNPAPGPS